MIPPEDRERLNAAIAQLSPEKPYLQIRYRMVRSDGNVVWVDRSSRAHFDEHGKMLRVVGMLADITDRVRAEEALQETQRQLFLVYSNVADCIFHVAVEPGDRYRFLSVNPAFLKATGLAEDQVVGKLVQEVIPEPSLTMVLRKYEEAIGDKKTVRWEETSEYPAGRKVGEVAVAPVFDETERCTHLIGAVHDVTERQRTEEALHASQEQLQALWNNSPAIMFIKDRQGRYLDHNPRFLKLTSLPREQILGKTDEEIFPPEQAAAYRANDRLVLEENRPIEFEEIAEQKDGVHASVVQKFPLRDAQGQPYAICGIVTDITERKLADEALAGMSRKLFEAQEQERSRIGRELHDDINQRLALLSVEIQRVREVSPVTYGELRSRMDELGKRTSEISGVVQSLSHELHSSRLEYLGLVSAMKGFCKEFGDKHKVRVDLNSEGMPPTVPPEVSLCLFRVMQEGLQNAVKHSGVKVFEVRLHGSPAEIQLTVRDSGVGFDPELIKDTQGLGLISMQERVRLVKGTISITSRPQSGTEINVRVALSAGAQTGRTKLAGA